MKPYYEREGVILYLGDCLDLSVEHDLLLADPPYGAGFISGKDSKRWGKIEGDDDLDGIHQRLHHVLRTLRRGRHCYIFGNKLRVDLLPLCGVTELIWDKQIIGLGNLSLPWGPQHEKITFAVYELSQANRAKGYGNLAARLRKGSVLRSLRPNSERVNMHPTEKPVDILRQMIESSSVMGEIVYDPFAGSGSTLVAALMEGRRAVGVEVSERYCETAARRIEAYLNKRMVEE